MPDKRRKCGSGCSRCWQNALKHANPQAKAFMKKSLDASLEVIGKTKEEVAHDVWEEKQEREGRRAAARKARHTQAKDDRAWKQARTATSAARESYAAYEALFSAPSSEVV